MEEDDVVTWTGTGQNGELPGWAGDGSCDVIEVDPRKAGFGPEGSVGQAVRIKLKARGGYTLWVSPCELDGL